MRPKEIFPEKLQALAYGIIRVTGVCIFLFLTAYSLIYSQYIQPHEIEIPITMPDKPIYNLLSAAILILFVLFLRYLGIKISSPVQKWIERIILVLSLLWVGGLGIWWINSVDRVPVGDQAYVYGGASYFLEKNFSFLSPGGYCDIYPYQLGLIALTELLFALVGTYNYYAFEVICVSFAVGIVWLGYGILKETDTLFGTRILYLALISHCIPLICYTSWVYGDIPSIFFVMAAAYFLLRYQNRPNWLCLAGMVGASTMALLVRKNSMIFLTALFLLAIVYTIRYRKWQIALAVLLALLCPYLCYQGIYKVYEKQSGYQHSSGLPINSWIAMGLQENNGVCGWYNNMPKEVLHSLSGDYEETRIVMADMIHDRISDFINDPKYAGHFFFAKITSQWNMPFYQGIHFSLEYTGDDYPPEGSFLNKVYNFQEEFFLLFTVADRIHFLIYLGVLFYFLFGIHKGTQPFEHLLAVTVIGGFFFSILWEAKARYVFPYYVIMYPLAATGYFRMTAAFRRLWKKLRPHQFP